MCMILFLIVPPVTRVSLGKEDEEDTEAGNKEEEGETLLSCINGYDGPSTSKDCPKEARVRDGSI